MDYQLTDHAKKRCLQRKIKPEWISKTLTHPERIENDEDDSSLIHTLLRIPEKNFRVLRVIYNEPLEPVAIVTAYFDDGVNDL